MASQTPPTDNSHHVVINNILGVIQRLNPEDQSLVIDLARQMRELVWNNGQAGQLALALIGAEVAASAK